MFKRVVASAIAAASIATASPTSAAELIVVDDQLTGANGVTFDDRIFDVAFVDGTCTDLFNGCDSEDDFVFKDRFDARLAAGALLEQVLIGIFDESPELTLGCELSFSCEIVVPFFSEDVAGDSVNEFGQSLFLQRSALNRDVESFDAVGGSARLRGVDTTDRAGTTMAVFTERSAVPEPATWAMMLVGFFGIGTMMRRRRTVPVRVRYSFD